jgi:acetyl-CoA acyltransferase
MNTSVIIDAVRTPVAKGKPGGAYSEIHPADLHAVPLRALVERTGIDPTIIDDVISGAVAQVGEQSGNTARWGLLAAGYPESVPGVTVDRQCGSSQQALHFAAQGVIAGAYDVAVASGVESMSRIPMGTQFAGKNFAGLAVAQRYAPGLIPQGISAELIAARWGLSRAQLDEYAAMSHRRAATAWKDGRFEGEIVRVNDLDTDETIRPSTTSESLAGLRLAFQDDHWSERFPEIDWKVTAGNSSPVNDGAAALLVMSKEAAEEHGLPARARVHSFAVAGDDPIFMLTGIIPATHEGPGARRTHDRRHRRI